MVGWKLLIVQPLDFDNAPDGDPVMAIDMLGAGHGTKVLITNDGRSKKLALRVEGRVRPAIMVSPSSLFMGVLQPGKQVTRQLVVRGKKAFRIKPIWRASDTRGVVSRLRRGVERVKQIEESRRLTRHRMRSVHLGEGRNARRK